MSMFWQGYMGDALVLSEEEFDSFLDEYSKAYQIDRIELGETLEDDTIDNYLFRSDAGKFSFVSVTGDSCEGMELISLTKKEESRYCGNSIVLFARRDRLSADAFENPPYHSYRELTDEFKGFLRQYLPEDFDWDEHIGVFRYACYA